MFLKVILFSALATISLSTVLPFHGGHYDIFNVKLEFMDQCKELKRYIVDEKTTANWLKLCEDDEFQKLSESLEMLCRNKYSFVPAYKIAFRTVRNNYTFGAVAFSEGNNVLTNVYPLSEYGKMINHMERLKREVQGIWDYLFERDPNLHNPLKFEKDNFNASEYFAFPLSYPLFNETLRSGRFEQFDQIIRGFTHKICTVTTNQCDISTWDLLICQPGRTHGEFHIEIKIPVIVSKEESASLRRTLFRSFQQIIDTL